jgi:hypothetical protein
MAKTRWIFGQQSSAVRDSTKPIVLPIVSGADTKKFGLENVRLHIPGLFAANLFNFSLEIPGKLIPKSPLVY